METRHYDGEKHGLGIKPEQDSGPQFSHPYSEGESKKSLNLIKKWSKKRESHVSGRSEVDGGVEVVKATLSTYCSGSLLTSL